MTLQIHQFACLQDNYGFLVRDGVTKITACIDVPDAARTLDELGALGWSLDLIVNTHWHRDHTGGNDALREATGALVIGPAEVARVSKPDRIVSGGDSIAIGSIKLWAIDVPGHTTGHLAYYDPKGGNVFVGDVLFALGCGRVFEGTPEQMWSSLSRLAALPEITRVYCSHEYSEANACFALSVDDSVALRERTTDIRRLRQNGLPTVPTTIGQERATNPFLRAAKLLPDETPVKAFALIRALKDTWHG